jgi:glycosyltransferase involved in cell wall biosynthesis
MISVIIPTLNSPSALDLCLKSATEGQESNNEILVVVDGDIDSNKDTLSKYIPYVKAVVLEKNVGTCKATNIGVYNAQYNNILIVNDDNVFPKNWDTILSKLNLDESVVTPNQIEPYNSMFRQFHICDLGRDPSVFDLEKFWKYELENRKNIIEYTGSTFPILINKLNYLRCGGFDSDYPGLPGMVADWEFFMKCEMNGLKMLRTYQCMFYHFVSVTHKTPEKIAKSQEDEKQCHLYFKYKWGQLAQHNPINNSKLLRNI